MPDFLKGPILGIDFGFKKMGLAWGRLSTKLATPLKSISAHQGEPHWPTLDQYFREWQFKAIVLGIPKAMDDSMLYTTEPALKFVAVLEKRYQVPVFCVDERLTTKEARQRVFELGGVAALHKADLDSIAAQIILEQWMNEYDPITPNRN